MTKPWSMGLAPDLHSLEKSVLSPIAARAATIRNLLIVFRMDAVEVGIRPMLQRSDMARKPRMNHGKTDFMLTFAELFRAAASFFFRCMLITEKTSTVGMMARVLVSLTMVAKSPAASLKAKPVATTLEVSLTAVPAQRPKAASDRPMARPRIGNTTIMMVSNRKVADMP